MNSGRPALWVIAAIDFALTYAYAFVANALPVDRSGPSAPVSYWATQPWVYALIAPIAAVAAWRGVRHVQRMRGGNGRWWRLTAEAAGCGVVPVVAIAVFESSGLFRAMLEAAVIAGGLGLLVTAVNMALDRPTQMLTPTHTPQHLELPHNDR